LALLLSLAVSAGLGFAFFVYQNKVNEQPAQQVAKPGKKKLQEPFDDARVKEAELQQRIRDGEQRGRMAMQEEERQQREIERWEAEDKTAQKKLRMEETVRRLGSLSEGELLQGKRSLAIVKMRGEEGFERLSTTVKNQAWLIDPGYIEEMERKLGERRLKAMQGK
jgi:hypothetical protein